MDFSEKWGKTVEEARDLALNDLNLTIDDVDVIVLEEPSKGFLGIGARLAKVRVVKKEKPIPQKLEVVREQVEKKEATTEEKQERKEKKEKTKHDKKPQEKKGNNKNNNISVSEKPSDLVSINEHPAIDFLKEVTEKMGLNLDVTAERNDDCIYLDIKGKDSGTIIGKRGQTLDAIQYLTSLVVNKEDEKYTRVVVDAENYRYKREKTLENLAERLANKVIKTKKGVRLEPMNPYERKVIHATLQGNPNVITRSEGEEPYRRVIIELK